MVTQLLRFCRAFVAFTDPITSHWRSLFGQNDGSHRWNNKHILQLQHINKVYYKIWLTWEKWTVVISVTLPSETEANSQRPRRLCSPRNGSISNVRSTAPLWESDAEPLHLIRCCESCCASSPQRSACSRTLLLKIGDVVGIVSKEVRFFFQCKERKSGEKLRC